MGYGIAPLVSKFVPRDLEGRRRWDLDGRCRGFVGAAPLRRALRSQNMRFRRKKFLGEGLFKGFIV